MQENANTETGKILKWHHEVVNFIYNVQVMRISKGYSQKELSFLLGLPGNRVAIIEGFTECKEYSIVDISLLTKIFECPVKEFFNPGQFPAEWLEMKVYKEYDIDGSVIYKAFALKENGRADLLYCLREKPMRMRNVRRILSSVKKTIDTFIASGYFNEGAEVIEIFKEARRVISEEFRPKHLAQVLRSYTLAGAASGLKRLLEDGHYYYVHPKMFY